MPPRMPVELRVAVIVIAILLVVTIVELVRKRLLREEYSWLWLLAGVGILAAAFVPFEQLLWLAGVFGSTNPSAAIFFLGFCAVLGLCLQFSVRLSRMTEQIKNLGQKISLLEAELARTAE